MSLGQGKKRKKKILFLEYFVASLYEKKPTQLIGGDYASLQLDEKKKPIQNHAVNIKL